MSNPDTALATQEKTLAFQQGALLPAGVPAEYRMTQDEYEELEDYAIRLLIVQFNGQDGDFKNVETKERYAELRGALLGVVDGQVLFGPDTKVRPEEKKWNWPAWICRNSNSKKGKPVLNATMTQEQKAEAIRRGAGSNCATCPLRQFRGDQNPECDKKAQLVWFDQELMQPCLVPAGGKSLKPVGRYVGSLKRDGVSMYSFVTRLVGDLAEDGSQKYFVLHLERGELIQPAGFATFRQLRQTIMAALDTHLDHADRAIDTSEGRAVEEPGPAPAPPAAPTRQAAAPARPAPSGGRGIVLTEDGEVAGDPADPFGDLTPEAWEARKAAEAAAAAQAEPTPPPPSDDDYTPTARNLPF